MKAPVLTAALALIAAAPAAARTPAAPRGSWPGAPADCPLLIAFGSYAAGIDQAAFARIERLLRTDRRVRSVTRHPWGREGEVTLCVRPLRLRDLNPLARDLRRMIPARPRGPIQVTVNLPLPYQR
jgi:hypothetical protein